MGKQITDEELLREIRANFTLAEEAEADVRADALDCWKFRAGDQWDPKMLRRRESSGRPCYVINRVPQFLRQVANEQKQSRPAMQVFPLGDGSDKESAEIVQGLARHVERVSDGEAAYDLAFDHALTGGFGFVRVRTGYVTSRSWNQDIIIEPVHNPFSVYLDPSAKKRDRRDARWGFIVNEMSAAEFAEEYPDSELAGMEEYSSVGDSNGWVLRDTVRVGEYYRVSREKRTLCKLSDGTTRMLEDVPQGARVIKQREQMVKVVTWYVTNGIEILDREEQPGDYVPIIPVLGEEFTVEGRRYLIGVVHWLRSPARLYNLWQSAMAETIALAPKAPYKATAKQIAGYEDMWESANEETYSTLIYNGDPQADGPPVRDFGEPPIQAIQAALHQADDDLKNTTGIYNPSLGAPGPEQSGKAILLRKKQGDQQNYGFLDAMAPAIRQVARVLISWIPTYYDAPRIIRIVRPDGSQETVPINQLFQDGAVSKIYDLTVGEYDIGVDEGPSMASRREEASNAIISLLQTSPQLMQIAGDLLVKNFDWPYADEIAERLKKMLPPQLQDQADGQQALPPAVQHQLAQGSAMIRQLTQVIHQISAKLEGQQVQAASKERIALIQARAGIIEAALKAKSQEAMAMLQADLDHIDRQLALIADPALGVENGGEQANPAAGAPPAAPGAVAPPTAPPPPQQLPLAA